MNPVFISTWRNTSLSVTLAGRSAELQETHFDIFHHPSSRQTCQSLINNSHKIDINFWCLTFWEEDWQPWSIGSCFMAQSLPSISNSCQLLCVGSWKIHRKFCRRCIRTVDYIICCKWKNHRRSSHQQLQGKGKKIKLKARLYK